MCLWNACKSHCDLLGGAYLLRIFQVKTNWVPGGAIPPNLAATPPGIKSGHISCIYLIVSSCTPSNSSVVGCFLYAETIVIFRVTVQEISIISNYIITI
jgi:hypothetical protein